MTITTTIKTNNTVNQALIKGVTPHPSQTPINAQERQAVLVLYLIASVIQLDDVIVDIDFELYRQMITCSSLQTRSPRPANRGILSPN